MVILYAVTAVHISRDTARIFSASPSLLRLINEIILVPRRAHQAAPPQRCGRPG